mmetsp:Transcript_5206/g.11773  ORF Transcript_5206/g.11773 Transcript_5206/m.11773 type:complete len:185 (-) Transcript_5206:17-571(-)
MYQNRKEQFQFKIVSTHGDMRLCQFQPLSTGAGNTKKDPVLVEMLEATTKAFKQNKKTIHLANLIYYNEKAAVVKKIRESKQMDAAIKEKQMGKTLASSDQRLLFSGTRKAGHASSNTTPFGWTVKHASKKEYGKFWNKTGKLSLLKFENVIVAHCEIGEKSEWDWEELVRVNIYLHLRQWVFS